MIGTRRIYDEWTAESDPAHQKHIGLILRLSYGAAIPPKQRKWPKCSQSGADLRKSEQMGVSRTYTCVLYLPTRSIVMENIGNNLVFKCKTRKMGFLYAPKHKHMTRKRGIHDEVFWEQTNTSTKWNTAAGISQTLNIFGGFRGYHTFARRELQAHRSDQLTLFRLSFAYFLRLTLSNRPIKTYM